MSKTDRLIFEIQEAQADREKASKSKMLGLIGFIIGILLVFFGSGILSIMGVFLGLAGILAFITQLIKENNAKQAVENLKNKL
jgi:VIT1/CCC1 family predicted Fe2+/Mn2+ transporter